MRRAFLAAVCLALACVPAARAGSVGSWERFTEERGSITSFVALHRTPDGVLHAAWVRANTGNADILTRTIAPNGGLGPVTPVVNWPGVSEPDISAGPGGGLLALWGGLKDNSTQSGLATSDDSGAAWTEGPQPATGGFIYGSPVAIENGAVGTVFEAWTSTTGTFVHRGTDSTTPNFNFQDGVGGHAASPPNLARDGGDGSLWLGWPIFSAGANNGAWAIQVEQSTGAPAGAPLKMPGSSTEYQGTAESTSNLGRWPMTGRPGRAGVFVAAPAGYPSADRIIVWRVGQPSSVTLDDGSDRHRQVAIAADPDGRIVVVWGTDGGPKSRLFARVSDPDVSAFAPAFEIPTPPTMTSLWSISASAQSGALIDVFANITDSDNQERFYHAQAVPPPVLGRAVNASVVSGEVFVKLPGSSGFTRVTHDGQFPVGAIVDATKGRVRIVTALPNGGTQSADFFQGVFKVTQARSGLATMALAGGSFSACGRARRGATAAKAVSVRKLWGEGKGKFRTKGRYAAATLRGTTWLTDDRCDGTLIRVTKGSVTVRDLVRKRNVVVTKGRAYLAKARR
jgi:hypothetical protein